MLRGGFVGFEAVSGTTYALSVSPFDPTIKYGFPVTEEQQTRIRSWADGTANGYIQDILSDLSADQRELLMSGIHPNEWDEMFGDTDEENHLVTC